MTWVSESWRRSGPARDRRKQPSGKLWTEFNKAKETITLKGLTGTVAVTAQY